MPDCIPFFEPGQDPTCKVNGGVTGCRFVQVKTGVNAVDDLTQVETCAVGALPFGVAARDKLDGETVMVYRDAIVPVLAGAALSHGQRVQSDAQGRAIPLAGGVMAGWVLADAADATLAKIALATGGAPATAVVGDQAAVVHLTNNTGVAGNDVVENVPAVVAAAGEATAADLATTQAAFVAVENDLADLTDKLNVALTRLEAAGLLTP